MRTSWKKPPENGATRNKLLWSLAALGAAGALAGLGTFATFTMTEPVGSGAIDTEDVELQVNAAGSLTVSNLVPGDSIQRLVELQNVADPLGSITLLVTSEPGVGTDPWEDPARIMTLEIERCDIGWASATATTCSDGTTAPEVVLSVEDLLGAHQFDLDLHSRTKVPTNQDNLRLTVTFLDVAGDNYQQQSTTVSYKFLGVQRTLTDK